MRNVFSLQEGLLWLKSCGCFPVVGYRGGGLWRAHVNGAGNWWDEGKTPVTALNKAIRKWLKGGRVMDGYGAPDIERR